jgi:uncharacterized cupin superfamily protein
MGITHFDDARRYDLDHGHFHAEWSLLGEAAGCVGIGLRRLSVRPGGWSTPAHEHGREEEIFYVLAGSGVSWQSGKTCELRAGDCVVYHPRRGAHALYAFDDGLDVLAFSPRHHDESVGFPRSSFSLVGRRGVESVDGAAEGYPVQFVREAAVGPPELPDPSPRPQTVVNVDDVEPHFGGVARPVGAAAQSLQAGLWHVRLPACASGAPAHCHSAEEELFVVLEGTLELELIPSPNAARYDGAEPERHELRAGHVVSRPPGTRIAHKFVAGPEGAVYLAYGTREPNDIAYYPEDNKVVLRGVGVSIDL